jgi:hypothetical protein
MVAVARLGPPQPAPAPTPAQEFAALPPGTRVGNTDQDQGLKVLAEALRLQLTLAQIGALILRLETISYCRFKYINVYIF